MQAHAHVQCALFPAYLVEQAAGFLGWPVAGLDGVASQEVWVVWMAWRCVATTSLPESTPYIWATPSRAVTERSAALSNGAGSVPLLFQASSMEGTRSGRRAGARVALSVLSGVSREADESLVFVVDRLSVCPVCRLFRL